MTLGKRMKMQKFTKLGLVTVLLTLPQITIAQDVDTTPSNADIGYISNK